MEWNFRLFLILTLNDFFFFATRKTVKTEGRWSWLKIIVRMIKSTLSQKIPKKKKKKCVSKLEPGLQGGRASKHRACKETNMM